VEKCRSCQYFDRNNAVAKDSKSTQWGQCRRGAPSLNPLNQKPHMIEGVWPHVRDDDWCGEFKGLAKRLDAQLSELMSDPIMASLGAEATIHRCSSRSIRRAIPARTTATKSTSQKATPVFHERGAAHLVNSGQRRPRT